MLLRSFAFPILIFLSNSPVFGQGREYVSLNLNSTEGEIRKYHIKSTSKLITENGNHYELSTIEKNITIRVLRLQKNKVDIEWTYDSVSHINTRPQLEPSMDLIRTLNNGMIVKYTVSEHGEILSISNSNEIILRVKQQIDGLIRQMTKDNAMDSSKMGMLKFQFEMILSSEVLLEVVVFGDIYKFHELYGKSFQKGVKKLIPAKDPPDDRYAVGLELTAHNNCRLSGELISSFSDKKGRETFEFEVPSYWLILHSLNWSASVPVNVWNSYEIRLTSK